MYHKCIKKVDQYPCIDLLERKLSQGLNQQEGGLHHTTRAHPGDKHS